MCRHRQHVLVQAVGWVRVRNDISGGTIGQKDDVHIGQIVVGSRSGICRFIGQTPSRAQRFFWHPIAVADRLL